MGKGDIKTKRGKIANQSFGKLRKHKTEPEKKHENTEDTISEKNKTVK